MTPASKATHELVAVDREIESQAVVSDRPRRWVCPRWAGYPSVRDILDVVPAEAPNGGRRLVDRKAGKLVAE